MRHFSIKELENFSEVKSHTIRVWEQRYKILVAQRKETNRRYYTLSQVEALLNLSLLTRNGRKISSLIKDNEQEIQLRLKGLETPEAKKDKAINFLIIKMFSNQIEDFENILNNWTFSFGIDNTIKSIIIPFLEKVHLLSYSDKRIEIHFVVTAVRRKIIFGIEKINAEVEQHKTALLFLPRGEHYDLMLLYIAYLLKNLGVNVLYLGTDISIENLYDVIQEKKPDFLYTYVSSGKQLKQLQVFAKRINTSFPSLRLFAATNERIAFTFPSDNTVNLFYHGDVCQTLDVKSLLVHT